MTLAPLPRPSETLLARLDDPQTAADLGRLLDRVGELNALFDMAESMLKRGPDLSNNVGRLIRETRERVPDLDTDLPRLAQQGARVGQALGTPEAQKLLSTLEDPATLCALNGLIEQLPDLMTLSQMAGGFLQRGPAISNNIGRLLREFRIAQAGPGGLGSLAATLTQVDVTALSRSFSNMTALLNSPEFQHLLGSGVFGREAVNLVGDIAQAATEAARRSNEQHLNKPSLMAAVRGFFALLRDPAVRRVLAFILLFVQQLGVLLYQRHRENEHGEPRPSASATP